jgi:hypothetical protein
MSFTIYYPLTITLIVIILNSILVYSIIKLNGTTFPNILNNECDIIPKCLIGIFVATGLFIFSLLPNCGFCSDNSNKVIRFISPILYYSLYIGITVEIYLNINCISTYKNSTDPNAIIFITVFGWNIISFSSVIHLMLLSFILSQCCNYCNKKKNNNLPINNEPLIILD